MLNSKSVKTSVFQTLLTPDTALIKDKDGKTCLHIAAEQGAIDACKLIVSIAGNQIIHQIDNKKQTPLHLAALNGHARVIKFLFEYGGETDELTFNLNYVSCLSFMLRVLCLQNQIMSWIVRDAE
jgi:ankyrin repeat protein